MIKYFITGAAMLVLLFAACADNGSQHEEISKTAKRKPAHEAFAVPGWKVIRKVCINGVLYYSDGTGLSVAFARNNKVILCTVDEL